MNHLSSPPPLFTVTRHRWGLIRHLSVGSFAGLLVVEKSQTALESISFFIRCEPRPDPTNDALPEC